MKKKVNSVASGQKPPKRNHRLSLVDHFFWIFRPHRFLVSEDSRKVIHIPGFETLYFADSADEVKTINRNTETVFLGGQGNAFLGPLLGNKSVFLLDGPDHKLARRIMGVALTQRAIHAHSDNVKTIINEELDIINERTTNIGNMCRMITMRTIAATCLGINDPTIVKTLFKRFEATTGILANFVSYQKRFWPDRGILSIGGIVAIIVRRIDKILYKIINERRLSLAEGKNNSQLNVLDTLIVGQKEHGYDDVFIRDNLCAILAAGYDTSGAALTWLCHWSHHASKAFSALNTTDRTACNKFRDEVLRYCPPIEILPRRIAKEKLATISDLLPQLDSVKDAGPNGPMVCPFVHRIHHDPAIYEKPEEFCPERFSGKTPSASETYLAFGGGNRFCAGAILGKLLMDTMIATLLDRAQRFEMRTSRFSPVRRNVSIWPSYTPKGRLVNLSSRLQ